MSTVFLRRWVLAIAFASTACDGGSGETTGGGGPGGATTTATTGGGGSGGATTDTGGGGAGGTTITTTEAGGSGGTGGSPCGPCGAHASCDESGACECDPGFTGDGQECDDFNECLEQTDDCADSATCTNTEGGFECACPPGTIGDPLAACSARYGALTAGAYHTCALRTDGATLCFGNGGSGRLGNGQSAHQAAPVQAGAASNWAQVVAGTSHTCGIKETGNAWCWGANGSGQLGLGHTDSQTLPAYVSLERAWTKIGAGETHTCAVEADGSLSCWGRNQAGQIGKGVLDGNELAPKKVSVDPAAAVPDKDWKDVGVGRDTTCGLKTNGMLYCWGQNSNLQVGKAGGGTVTAPHLVETALGAMDADWAQVAVSFSTCAIKTDGSLWCWGRNAEGQLANGNTTQTATPFNVAAGEKWKVVRTTGFHACGLKEDGTLWCWGRNQSAQIVAGGESRILAPQKIDDATDWVDVAPGVAHTCALKQDQTVWCWGSRVFGQTGDKETLGVVETLKEDTDAEVAAEGSKAARNIAARLP